MGYIYTNAELLVQPIGHAVVELVVQERAGGDLEGSRELGEMEDGEIADAAFDARQVDAVHTAAGGQTAL